MNYITLYKTKRNKDLEDILKDVVPDELTYHNRYFSYDFNNGFRIKFNDLTINYKLIILDKITRCVYYKDIIRPEKDTIYCYEKKYLINYEIIVLKSFNDNMYDSIPLKVITYDIKNKDVLIILNPSLNKANPPGLGDAIAWMTAIYKFKLKNPKTNVYVYLAYKEVEDIFKKKYNDEIIFISEKDVKCKKFYATYLIGCFYNNDYYFMNEDYQNISLVEWGYTILGLPHDKEFKLDLSFDYKEDKPYVCIATHASSINKEWLCKNGWYDLVKYLKNIGYNVYDIDAQDINKSSLVSTEIPSNAINKTGYHISLIERAKLISGADFFIGLSSGLSWLAWCCNVPVILISGFTHPKTEFFTPYRIINTSVCNSCWNDKDIKWLSSNTCPRKNDMFNDSLECSMEIDLYMVIDAIKRIRNDK